MKSPFSWLYHHFPMVFPWFSHGFPRVQHGFLLAMAAAPALHPRFKRRGARHHGAAFDRQRVIQCGLADGLPWISQVES